MPGPFPSMDPYLEDPVLWPGVHLALIPAIRAALNAVLPSRYVADIGERLLPAEAREVFVKVLPVGDPERIVTVIEVLSSANKAHGSPGRDLYLRKQEEILNSDTHLVEIDLLRRGEHTVAAPLSLLRQEGRWNYLVCRHLAGTGDRYQLWPILLPNPLPRIRIPLGGDDLEVEVDLQPLFDQCYNDGAYERRIGYDRDPVVPLAPEDAAWANALLREKGLRT